MDTGLDTSRELETAAVMSWSAENSFALSLVLQDGIVGTTFPFYSRHRELDHGAHDGRFPFKPILGLEDSRTGDDDVFRHIAADIIRHNKKYSERNISCYYRAEAGLENGYRLSHRYRKLSLRTSIAISSGFLQDGPRRVSGGLQLPVYEYPGAESR